MPDTWWTHEETGNNQDAKKEIIDFFGDGEPFSTPKPTKLIRRMLQVATSTGADIVMDFFAGSCSTADAVLQLNKEDGGRRKFIMVQLPEPTGRPDFKTISAIGRERIARVASKLKDLSHSTDNGFRAFRLDSSCFHAWSEGQASSTEEDFIKRLEHHANHYDANASSNDQLFELLLKDGFSPTVPIQQLTLAGKEVFSIAGGALLICLDKQLTQEVIDAMADMEPSRVICLDVGFQGNDQLKANAVQTFKARARNRETAIEFRTV